MHRNDWVFHYEYEISENDLDPKLKNREGMEIVAEEQLEGAPKSKDTLDSLRRFPLGGFTELGGPGLEREGASAAAAACAAAGYHLRRIHQYRDHRICFRISSIDWGLPYDSAIL